MSHNLVIQGLSSISKNFFICSLLKLLYASKTHHQPRDVMGIQFPNPVGLAAGLDKQASACNALHALGFGWIEMGTVLPKPQNGNPMPRMFRLKEQKAIINRMGFNSVGLKSFIDNLQFVNPKIIKGVNIGKNLSTPIDRAIDDYLTCLRAVSPYADYVAINISSPNTKHLKDLQKYDTLKTLLQSIHTERNRLADQSGEKIPIVLKISPDLNQNQINDIATLMRFFQIDGVIATNTTVKRHGIETSIHKNEIGGLSGPTMHNKSVEVIRALYRNLEGEIPIIGVGGIDSAGSALETLEAGAELIQIYTGLLYHGPVLISKILDGIYRAKHVRI